MSPIVAGPAAVYVVVGEVVGEIDSTSQPGILHLIKRHPGTDRLSCDCMAWRFSRGDKHCKHVDAFQTSELRATMRGMVASIRADEQDLAGVIVPMAISPTFTEQTPPRPGVRRLRLRD